MALIKCKECGKQISDTANVCMGCGAPVGGGDSVGNAAFEKRIEQYRTNGYVIRKREDNTVKLYKQAKTFATSLTMGCVMLATFGGFLMFSISFFVGLLVLIISIFGVVSLTLVAQDKGTVSISITKTGKIEETGNVLKKK